MGKMQTNVFSFMKFAAGKSGQLFRRRSKKEGDCGGKTARKSSDQTGETVPLLNGNGSPGRVHGGSVFRVLTEEIVVPVDGDL